MFSERGDSRLFRDLVGLGLEDHFLSVRLVALEDLDVLFKIGGNDAIEILERRTDGRFATGSCDACHRDFISRGLRLFSHSHLEHGQGENRERSRDNFDHNN